MMRVIAALILIFLGTITQAHEAHNYPDMAQNTLQWFRDQRNPTTHMPCCSETDGMYAEEDIRDGHYWTRGGPFKDWVQVPDDVVIHDPNRNGAPVLWWMYQDGKPILRCFAPGGGV